ncbi:MAG TPA: tripartite tricarboxylate transporter substrate binding protein [Xanthobacteraceae bacterium]|nr:tripartite tricarboxylate transporter substrate binding protein [Xanthobacteraceae bacterium]
MSSSPLKLLLCAFLALALTPTARAEFPERPLKMLVGFSAGGGTDVAARIVAPGLAEALGQAVVVENRPGASGLIAAEAVARAAPDGYTLMMGSQTTLAVAPRLYAKFTLDAPRDFAGVALTSTSPLVLVVNPKVAAHSVAELIALAKAQPGKLNFASGGVGTTPHMAGELFRLTAGINVVHVAYRGEAPAINDLLGGQIPMMFSNLSAVIGQVRAGALRALAVASPQRSATAPDIPTLAEQGLPGCEVETWFGVVAPAGTPKPVIAKINAGLRRVLALPDTQARLAGLGMSAAADSPEEFDGTIKAEIAKWGKVIRDADIKAAE